MSETWFSTQERVNALVLEAQSWVPTPCVPHGNVKRKGVDCLSFVAEIYLATGFLAAYPRRSYAMDSGLHLRESALEREIEATGKFELVWRRPETFFKQHINIGWTVKIGDSLTFNVGKVAHHVALAIGCGKVIHVMRGPGVAYSELGDSALARRVQSVYRPKP